MFEDDDTETMHMHVHAATAKALLLSEHGDENYAAWIPRSQIVSAGTTKKGEEAEFVIKRWVLEKNDLI